MSRREEAVAGFGAWLAAHGEGSAGPFSEDDWTVSEYREGFVFAPAGGLRSNMLHVVRGEQVAAFSPALASLEEVYEGLAGPRSAG